MDNMEFRLKKRFKEDIDQGIPEEYVYDGGVDPQNSQTLTTLGKMAGTETEYWAGGEED